MRLRPSILAVVLVVAVILWLVLSRGARRDVAVGGGRDSRMPNGPVAPSEDPEALRRARPPILPDPTLTPGVALDVTAKEVCVPGYATKTRNVPSSVKRKAYLEYGIPTHRPGEYEVDHLISLQLGGSNALANLWPQSFETQPWNAHTKDRLESELHRLVCDGRMSLVDAQREIAGDWVAAYRRRFGAPPAGPSTDAPPAEPDR